MKQIQLRDPSFVPVFPNEDFDSAAKKFDQPKTSPVLLEAMGEEQRKILEILNKNRKKALAS